MMMNAALLLIYEQLQMQVYELIVVFYRLAAYLCRKPAVIITNVGNLQKYSLSYFSCTRPLKPQ